MHSFLRISAIALLGSFSSTNAFTVVSPSPSRLPTSLSVAATAPSSSTSAPPPLSPLTSWGDKIDDIAQLQEQMRSADLPSFSLEISAVRDWKLSSDDTAGQLKAATEKADELKEQLQAHGAIVFRDFDLMKSQEGFQQFYAALGMRPCLDPLHSVAARPTVDGSKNSPVYEAVNKESRKNFFIGMHNEFVGTRAPRAAAFCCFKPAEVGGEFLIADGRRILRDLDTNLLKELYQRQIRYSVMELPFFDWLNNLPSPLQSPAQAILQTVVGAAINAKVDFDVELLWQSEGKYKNKDEENKVSRFLQARAPRQPPVVLHPVTGEPTWFCNVHSHSSKLRKDREAIYGAERFEDGASRINKSDMFFGDNAELTEEQLKQLDEITNKHIISVKMNAGDVVLLDNYKILHGRNVFDGTRKHGVCWFEGWEGEQEMMAKYKEQQNKELVSSP
jgi:alpha-ketoglutarate-dependent taurine dioxygenase